MKSPTLFVTFCILAAAVAAVSCVTAWDPEQQKQRKQKEAEAILRSYLSDPKEFLAKKKLQDANLERIFSEQQQAQAQQQKKNNNQQQPRLIDFAQPLLGTAGFGWGSSSVSPGAQRPFGAMRMAPETSLLSLDALGFKIPFQEGGYFYPDAKWGVMEGIAHTSVVGSGMPEWQNFLFTAVRVSPSTSPSSPPPAALIKNAGYRSKFRHETEVASPGYYSVLLDTPNVTIESTPFGTLAGVHRFECHGSNNNDDCAFVFDICHSSPRTGHLFDFEYACVSATVTEFEQTSPDEVSMSVDIQNAGQFLKSAPGGQGIHMYAHVRLTIDKQKSPAGTKFGAAAFYRNLSYVDTSSGASIYDKTTSHSSAVIIPVVGSGSAGGAFFEARVALSFINTTFAKNNLMVQSNNLTTSFADALNESESIWEERLSRFHVPSATSAPSDDSYRFYSGIYRMGLSPTDYTEPVAGGGGAYVGLDNQVHFFPPSKNGFKQRRLSDLSLWDIYRGAETYLALSDPETQANVLNSVLSMHEEAMRPPLKRSNYLPLWPMANVECFIMVGAYSAEILMASLMRNLSSQAALVDWQHAFNVTVSVVREQNNKQMPANANNLHYSPIPGGYGHGVGGTLELSIIADSVANAAKFVGRHDIAAEFAPYANASQNLWNSNSKLFCNRYSNGTFDCPSTSNAEAWLPHPWDAPNFVESSAILYALYYPQNFSQVIQNFGGEDAFGEHLDNLFLWNPIWTDIFNTTLPSPFVWLGNEPACAVLFQFLYSNRLAWRANFWKKQVLDAWYARGVKSNPGGNDDYGAMSSSFTGMMLGFYPINPTNEYALLAPSFDRWEIRVPHNNGGAGSKQQVVVRMVTTGFVAGVTNYLANATVNGVALLVPRVSHTVLVTEALAKGLVPTITMHCVQTPVTFGSNEAPWMPKESDKARMAKGEKKMWEILGGILKKLKL